MRSQFSEAKKTFIDEIRVDEFIELENSVWAYRQLEDSLDESLKMVLLFGKPGTGKTMLLHRIYNKKKYQKDIHLIDTPTGNRLEFYEKLFFIFTGKKMPPNSKIHFETFVEYGKRIKGEREISILLDEAQMYPKQMLEEIRILCDTGSIKFFISVHKTDNEDILAKEHFTTRIWRTIELRNADSKETKTYVYKRLLNCGLTELANRFNDRHFKLIYQLTDGNLRECNKLLYTAFEIGEFYEKNGVSNATLEPFPIKFLEMSAIKTGMINV